MRPGPGIICDFSSIVVIFAISVFLERVLYFSALVQGSRLWHIFWLVWGGLYCTSNWSHSCSSFLSSSSLSLVIPQRWCFYLKYIWYWCLTFHPPFAFLAKSLFQYNTYLNVSHFSYYAHFWVFVYGKSNTSGHRIATPHIFWAKNSSLLHNSPIFGHRIACSQHPKVLGTSKTGR